MAIYEIVYELLKKDRKLNVDQILMVNTSRSVNNIKDNSSRHFIEHLYMRNKGFRGMTVEEILKLDCKIKYFSSKPTYYKCIEKLSKLGIIYKWPGLSYVTINPSYLELTPKQMHEINENVSEYFFNHRVERMSTTHLDVQALPPEDVALPPAKLSKA